MAEAAIAAAAYSALTVLAFRPLLADIAGMGILTGDVLGNLWALDWVSRHLLAPARLFAANIYYPDPASLAYTESLLAQSLVAGPLLALSVPLVAAYNILWLLTFPLSGLGAFLLGRHLTGSRVGAALAGLTYAFSSYRLESLAHLQTLSIQWLPFVVLFLVRCLKSPTLRNLAGLDAFVLLQALSSGYYAALLGPALLLPLGLAARRAGRRPTLRILAALGIAAVVASPTFLPYWQAQRALGLERHHQDLVNWSAGWSSYLRASARLWSPTLAPLRDLVQEGPACYPGTVALLLAGAALVLRPRPVGLLIVLGATGVLLSLGPEVCLGPWTVPGPYEAIRTLPGFRLLRTPYRMAPMAMVAFSALAAVGWAGIEERWPGVRRWAWIVVLAATMEAVCIRSSGLFEALPGAQPFARWLATAPKGPVLEIPWTTYSGPAVYASVFHRQRLVNGWGAFAPPESIRIGMWGKRWPGPGAVHVLRGAGVRYVVAHVKSLPWAQQDRLAAAQNLPRGVSLVAQFGEDRIYAISAEGPADPPGPEAKERP
jgi:hypothetical protein